MPSDSSSGGPRKTSARTSIRHSLNFASVGKAFADVINKESRDADKSARKAAKDSHRLSATVGLKPAAPRASLDARPSPPPSKRSRTPDSKTITARRRSSLAPAVTHNTSVEDSSAKATPQSAAAKPSSLKPRPGSISSGLPKYRPKSIIRDNGQKVSSPGLGSTRKRPSISDEEKEAQESKDSMKRDSIPTSGEKGSRPISPLPHRAAFKVNLTNLTPSATPPKSRTATPTRASPTRLTKTAKAVGTIPRPSSSSSSSSLAPRTPRDSPTRSAKGSVRSAKPKSNHVSDSSPSPSHSGLPESPLVRHVRQRSRHELPASETVLNMSNISEGDSDDDEEDVEILLAPVASPGEPTPAMPRIKTTRTRQRLVPQTPSKPSMSTDTSQLLQTPTKDSPSFLRPNPSPSSAERIGSILSWEQLATEASRTMDVDELGKMLSDVPAPFQAGPLSPMHTGAGLLVPESPFGAPDTPSTYGSISQILLPNVTPSPAVPRHGHTLRHKNSKSGGLSADAAVATLLRLQLASAENTAKERLARLQLLEEEIHNLKQMRAQDAEQLSMEVSVLEEKMKGSLEERERSEEEQTVYIASLEEKLRRAEACRGQAIQEAVKSSEQAAQSLWGSAMRSQRLRIDAASSSHLAACHWEGVRDRCEDELDVLKADRETLSLLLAELDLAQQQLVHTMV